jgi:hypothetical protein
VGLSKDMNRILTRHYYDLNYPEAYTSKTRLIKKFKDTYPIKDIENWVSEQENLTKFAFRKTRFKKQLALAHKKDQIWASDLLFYNKYAKENRNLKYVVVVVDVLTRYTYAFATKNKHPSSLVEGFRKIFKKAKPSLALFVDNGTEFKSVFKEFMNKNGVEIWISNNSETKSFLAEHKIKLIKTRLEKYMAETKSRKWYSALQNIVDGINNSYNRNLGFAPAQIKTKADQKTAFLNLYKSRLGTDPPKTKLAVGDKVRVSLLKDTFAKGYSQKFSNSLYTISKVIPKNNINLYKLTDSESNPLLGSFYVNEIVPVKK